MKALSTKPYLLRAIWEWAEDSGMTPQLMVNAHFDGVVVPKEYVSNGQIVLNVSTSAIEAKVVDSEKVAFSARFNGVSFDVFLPMNAIEAIFTKENAQGIYFESDESIDLDEEEAKDSGPSKKSKSSEKSPTKKSDRSHLKIIK